MCGIVGYIGEREAAEVLLEGLRKLEYRGYDSAGIAVMEEANFEIHKSVGKLKNLEDRIGEALPAGGMGIGHTRWATHGRPSDVNSHPHSDCTGHYTVVHNGIIENYLELRTELSARGHIFKSQTDTEVLAHLMEEAYEGNLEQAVYKVLQKVHGSYAVVFMTDKEPGKLVAARKDNPLVVGLGDGEYFLASDIPAILQYTRDTYILDDGEVAILTRQGVKVTDRQGIPIEKEVYEVKWDPAAAEKGGYDHFMLKEIHEQPKAIRDTLLGRLSPDGAAVLLEETKLDADFLRRVNKVVMVACGTAYHAGLVGKCLIEQMARVPVEADVASEFRYRDPLVDENTLAIVVSQSGETADTLAGLREARSKGAKVLAVTNVVGSTIAREADHVLYTWAGPEIAVASTKAYTTQLIAMYLVALQLAQVRGTMSPEAIKEVIAGLKELPAQVEEVLAKEDEIKAFVAEFEKWQDTFFIGRGLDYYVALEGSLKLKEISYIHAEAYAAGELKHGTLALIEPGIPVISLATQESVLEKTVSNIQEVRAREAKVLSIGMAGHDAIESHSERVFYIPKTHPLLAPVLTVIPLQILSYYVAVDRGCDVDKPRNLAKSVTVE